MTETINAEGSVPIPEDGYKLLINNVFTPEEIGIIASSLANSLSRLTKDPKALSMVAQKNTLSTALGKVLLSMPPHFRSPVLQLFKEQLGLDFVITEKQSPTPVPESINGV